MENNLEKSLDNYYKLLGINPNASEDEIKRAYRSQARKHHPDKVIQSDDANVFSNRSTSTDSDIMKELNKAYETLSDERARKEYDAKLLSSDDYSIRINSGYLKAAKRPSDRFRTQLINLDKNQNSFDLSLSDVKLEDENFVEIFQFHEQLLSNTDLKCHICSRVFSNLIEKHNHEFFFEHKQANFINDAKPNELLQKPHFPITVPILHSDKWINFRTKRELFDKETFKNSKPFLTEINAQSERVPVDMIQLISKLNEEKTKQKLGSTSDFSFINNSDHIQQILRALNLINYNPTIRSQETVNNRGLNSIIYVDEISANPIKNNNFLSSVNKFTITVSKSLRQSKKENYECRRCRKSFTFFFLKWINDLSCIVCGYRFCQDSCITRRSIPLYGLISPVPICHECATTYQRDESRYWLFETLNICKKDNFKHLALLTARAILSTDQVTNSIVKDFIQECVNQNNFLLLAVACAKANMFEFWIEKVTRHGNDDTIRLGLILFGKEKSDAWKTIGERLIDSDDQSRVELGLKCFDIVNLEPLEYVKLSRKFYNLQKFKLALNLISKYKQSSNLNSTMIEQLIRSDSALMASMLKDHNSRDVYILVFFHFFLELFQVDEMTKFRMWFRLGILLHKMKSELTISCLHYMHKNFNVAKIITENEKFLCDQDSVLLDLILCSISFSKLDQWLTIISRLVENNMLKFANVCLMLARRVSAFKTVDELITLMNEFKQVENIAATFACAYFSLNSDVVSWKELADLFVSKSFPSVYTSVCLINTDQQELLFELGEQSTSLDQTITFFAGEYLLTQANSCLLNIAKVLFDSAQHRKFAIDFLIACLFNGKLNEIELAKAISLLEQFHQDNYLMLHELIKRIETKLVLSSKMSLSLNKLKKTSADQIDEQIERKYIKENETLIMQLTNYFYSYQYENLAKVVETIVETKCVPKYVVLRKFYNEHMKPILKSAFDSQKAVILICRAALSAFESRWMDMMKFLNEVSAMFIAQNYNQTIFEMLQVNWVKRNIMVAIIGECKNRKFINLDGNSILFDGNVSLPDSKETLTMLIHSAPDFNVLKRSDKVMLSRFGDKPEEAMFYYIDLAFSASSLGPSLASWTGSILWCIRAMKNKSHRFFEYKNMAMTILYTLFYLSRYSTPTMRLYTYRLILNVSIRISCMAETVYKHSRIFDKNELNMFESCLENLFDLIPIMPLVYLPTELPYDVLIGSMKKLQLFNYSLDQLDERLIWNERAIVGITPSVLSYYLFEGAHSGWYDIKGDEEDEDEGDEIKKEIASRQQVEFLRVNCILKFFEEKSMNLFHLTRLLNWPVSPKKGQGWYSSKSTPLVFPSTQKYWKIGGVKIDLKRCSINLLLSPPVGKEPYLFDTNDIYEIFTNNIGTSLFSLDQLDSTHRIHPLQKMRFNEQIEETNYLMTMFHTDYLLKFFTTGSEVSSKFPFKMRSTHDGLLKRLPKHLQEILKPLHERNNYVSRGGVAHRFWIESQPFTYQQVNSDDCLLIYFETPKMKVKKHLLKVDTSGNMVDADEDDEDSCESQFADDFTKYYDEIGQYFPEFARLRELVKISAAQLMITSYLQSLGERVDSNAIQEIRTSITSSCSKIKAQVGVWPESSSQSVIQTYMDTIMADLEIKHGRLDYSQRNEVENQFRNEIVNKLRERDNKTLDSVMSAFQNAYSITDSYQLREKARYYLQGTDNHSLVEMLVNENVANIRNMIRNFERSVPNKKRTSKFKLSEKHYFSPASFCSILDSRIVYGGVFLNVSFKSGTLNSWTINSINTYNTVPIPQEPIGSSGGSRGPPRNNTIEDDSSDNEDDSGQNSSSSNVGNLGDLMFTSPREMLRHHPELIPLMKEYKTELLDLHPMRDLIGNTSEGKEKYKRFLESQFEKLNTYYENERINMYGKAAENYNSKQRFDHDNNKYVTKKAREDFVRYYGAELGINDVPKGYEVHHIVPLNLGGPNLPFNYVLVKIDEHRGKKDSLHSGILNKIERYRDDYIKKKISKQSQNIS